MAKFGKISEVISIIYDIRYNNNEEKFPYHYYSNVKAYEVCKDGYNSLVLIPELHLLAYAYGVQYIYKDNKVQITWDNAVFFTLLSENDGIIETERVVNYIFDKAWVDTVFNSEDK